MAKIYEALENSQGRLRVLDRSPEVAPFRPPVISPPSKFTQPLLEEEIRLYQNLEALLPDTGKKVIQFIGSREGEGTSTVVREFAKVSAMKFGRMVLLLDADQHHPSQHLFFHVVSERGWQEVARENGPIEKALHQFGETRLFISPSSEYSASHPHVYDSLLIDVFWKKLRQRFDLILIDSPPATLSADGLAISSKADGVVLVVEAEKTRWPVVENVRDRIKSNGGNILGIVLNKRQYHIPEWIYKRL